MTAQASTMLPLRLLATGKALPATRVDSAELDRRFGRPRGWTQRKSGVQQRYFADAQDVQSELAAQSLCHAIERAGISAQSIDLVLSTAAIAEQALPCMAPAIAASAGLPAGVAAFDVNASCLGFLAGLQMAAGLLYAGTYRRIAIVASDLPSRGVDWRKPEASLIFGDGAAAAIVESGANPIGICAYRMENWPQWRELCEIRAGGTRCTPRTGVEDDDFLFRMEGTELFRRTLALIDGFLAALLRDQSPLSSLDCIIPHQASHLAMRHLARHLCVPVERMMDIYASYGNQVSASLPTALHEALVTQRVTAGDRVLLMGTAAGLSLGGLVLQL